MDGVSGAGNEPFPWESLVCRVLHPIQVAVIEALVWIGPPLAPSDIARMFGGQYSASHIAYHVKILADRGVLALADTEPVRGAMKHYYALAPESRWR